MLLQHAIDSIASTFYTQVMFADFELQAHRLVEQDQPVTAEALNAIYSTLLREYYGDVIDEEQLSRVTWARIPHFFSTPYYVYQYATCFASTARLMQDLRRRIEQQADGVRRYLSLLGPAAAITRWTCSTPGSTSVSPIRFARSPPNSTCWCEARDTARVIFRRRRSRRLYCLASVSLSPRTRLGPYEVIGQIGAGGMTEEDDEVKAGPPELFSSPQFDEGSPSFHPMGGGIAFVTDRSGRNEVAVRAFPPRDWSGH